VASKRFRLRTSRTVHHPVRPLNIPERQLFLSGKRGNRIHNIFRKLDVGSRVEVARAVERYERERPLP
jgi:hypothetical protein